MRSFCRSPKRHVCTVRPTLLNSDQEPWEEATGLFSWMCLRATIPHRVMVSSKRQKSLTSPDTLEKPHLLTCMTGCWKRHSKQAQPLAAAQDGLLRGPSRCIYQWHAYTIALRLVGPLCKRLCHHSHVPQASIFRYLHGVIPQWPRAVKENEIAINISNSVVMLFANAGRCITKAQPF
jgi:hypothetical protein